MDRSTGKRIREIRQSQKMTITELAKVVMVSKSLISQVERGEVLPSLPTLEKIATALKVPIGDVFKIETQAVEEEDIVVRKACRKKIMLPNSSTTYYMLTPNLREKLEFLLIEVPPDTAEDKMNTFSHEGREYFMIIEGQLVLHLGDKEYVLEEGDSGCFDSSQRHVFNNRSGKKAAFLIAATESFL